MNSRVVYILGAGAIGKALAVFLKLKGVNVILVRTRPDDSASSEELVTVQMHDQSVLEATIEITSLDRLKQLDGIVLLTNKSFANMSVASRLIHKIGNSPIVIMQNGLNVEEPFIESGFKQVCRCVLFATSQVVSSHMIRFKPVAVSPIGLVTGDDSQIKELINDLDNEYLRFASHNSIQTIAWKKTIANCVFNSICPLLDIDNGLFHRNEAAQLIAKRVIKECVAVANEIGISLDFNEVMNTVLLISKSSDGQLISTLQDIKNGRETEIESLNFAIAKIAEATSLKNKVVETTLLGELARLKSALAKLPD